MDTAVGDKIHEVLSDHIPRSAKWIHNELSKRGMEVSSQKVRAVCIADPMIEVEGRHRGRDEYRLVKE